MKLSIYSLLMLFLIVISCQENKPSITKISAIELVELVSSTEVQLIDVRTKAEVERGAIDGALHLDISKGDFSDRIRVLDPKIPTVVYCAVGSRSAMAASLLKDAGFSQVYDLTTGFGSWKLLENKQ